MHILISIDDTDDLDSRGTGEIAELLASGITEQGLGVCGRVTRHQLLVDPAIAYTSHNSAMCFTAQIDPEALQRVIAWSGETLAQESVKAADPGLCVVAVDRLEQPARLIGYGKAAKERVFTKEEAYGLAEELDVHLSEHGGTGLGVIGALAGAGLRLSGRDGRFKGKFRIPSEGGVTLVSAILAHDVDSVRTMAGETLGANERVMVGDECKLVLLDGMAVLLVEDATPDVLARWQVLPRKALRGF